MKAKLSPVVVGSFVCGALVLIVAALLSFRTLHLFSKPGRFAAYFDESVQGLDVGSAVKLRGVRVGRVMSISVHYDAKDRKSQVFVIAELDQDVVTDRGGELLKLADRATLQRLIAEGLRAQINLVGITGLQYVELDFLDPQKFPAPLEEVTAQYPVVPAVSSGMSEMIANLSKVVSDLHEADFAGLSRELKTLLATANHQVGEVDLKGMVAQVTGAANSIEALANSADAKLAFANLNKTAADVQTLVAKLDTQVEPVREDLVRTLHSFHDASENVRKLAGPQSGLGEEAFKTLRHISDAADSLQRLADYLERNPNAFISGKKAPR